MGRTTDDECVTLVRQSFTVAHLRRLRQLVTWAAGRVGLDRERAQRLMIAVTEAATNAIRHGGGSGRLDLIKDDSRALVAQISDHGPGMPKDASATLPTTTQNGGRGLFLIHNTCDRVVYRSGPAGTTVQLEISLDGEAPSGWDAAPATSSRNAPTPRRRSGDPDPAEGT